MRAGEDNRDDENNTINQLYARFKATHQFEFPPIVFVNPGRRETECCEPAIAISVRAARNTQQKKAYDLYKKVGYFLGILAIRSFALSVLAFNKLQRPHNIVYGTNSALNCFILTCFILSTSFQIKKMKPMNNDEEVAEPRYEDRFIYEPNNSQKLAYCAMLFLNLVVFPALGITYLIASMTAFGSLEKPYNFIYGVSSIINLASLLPLAALSFCLIRAEPIREAARKEAFNRFLSASQTERPTRETTTLGIVSLPPLLSSGTP